MRDAPAGGADMELDQASAGAAAVRKRGLSSLHLELGAEDCAATTTRAAKKLCGLVSKACLKCAVSCMQNMHISIKGFTCTQAGASLLEPAHASAPDAAAFVPAIPGAPHAGSNHFSCHHQRCCSKAIS